MTVVNLGEAEPQLAAAIDLAAVTDVHTVETVTALCDVWFAVADDHVCAAAFVYLREAFRLAGRSTRPWNVIAAQVPSWAASWAAVCRRALDACYSRGRGRLL